MSRVAKDFYLALVCASGYEDQEPACNYAKWYDLLWFALPIIGFVLFINIVKDRHDRAQ